MSEPHDRTADELISAFLDGELDSQQRAQVEQLLDSEPRYQQMLEELRTLRETLQSLPCQRLDAGFQERVLRIAEERSAAAIQATPARKPESGDNRGASSSGYLRGLFWAAAAVAAAILLTVMGPQAGRDHIGPIAHHEPALDAAHSTPVPTDRESDEILRGAAPARDEGSFADGVEPAETAAKAPPAPADGATSNGFYVRPSKAGHETFERVPTPIAPDGRFDPSQTNPLKQADVPPESGLTIEFDAPSEVNLKRRAGAALGGIVPDEAAPVARAPTGTSSAESAADAEIHVRLARTEKNAEARLTDNLLRNQIAVVQQEPQVADQRQRAVVQQELPELLDTQAEMKLNERARKERAVRFADQAPADLALMPTEGEAEPKRQFLVRATITQMATAVNQLQEEGGTVLAVISEPPPAAAPLAEGHAAAGRRVGRTTLSPDQLKSWHAGEVVSPFAPSPSRDQQKYQYHQYRALFRDPQELQKQLVDLTAGRGGERPLQFLIVLHGQEDLAPAAVEAAEADPTTAPPAADSAPSEPP